MAWSSFQESIFEWAGQPGHLVIKAGAGCGKTTTIVELYKRIIARDNSAKIIFLAFNKKIADELQARGVPAKTLNAFGNQIIKANFPKAKMNIDKLRDIAKTEGVDYKSVGLVTRCASLMKAYLTDLDCTPEKVQQFVDDYALAEGRLNPTLIFQILNVFRRSVRDTSQFDFDDQLCFSYYHNLNVPKHDYVIVDECQDLAPNKLELVSAIKPEHLIAVGDPLQAIYGFCGADSLTIQKIEERFNPTIMPLPVTYRCGKQIVKHAHDLGVAPKGFAAGDDNHEGSVTEIPQAVFHTAVKPKDFVLCRCTAPLVRACFGLLKNGIRAMVLGRDIGKRLTDLITKVSNQPSTSFNGQEVADFLAKLKGYHAVERMKLLAAEKESAAEILDDQVECIMAFTEGANTIIEMKSKIERLFDDNANPDSVIFSTVHKAKGLESDTVFTLPWKGFKPRNEAQAQEEKNLLYVMVTRAKQKLVYVR